MKFNHVVMHSMSYTKSENACDHTDPHIVDHTIIISHSGSYRIGFREVGMISSSLGDKNKDTRCRHNCYRTAQEKLL